MWEDRFATPEYVYGTAPSRFLRLHEEYLRPGMTALSVAEGEGRNAVFMAQKGLAVTALETAPSAQAKARALAQTRGVTVDFRDEDVLDRDWERDAFDIVVGIFIQFVGPADRARLFARMADAVAPNGVLMVHGYTPEQIAFGTGGPPCVENLYTETILRDAFPAWRVEVCRAYEAVLSEGTGHAGRSALIDFIARKPAA